MIILENTSKRSRLTKVFSRSADTKTNQLEIEKVKLRLPSLRRQIQLGQGVKRKSERPRQP